MMKVSVTKAGIVLAGLFLGQSAFAQTCPTNADAWTVEQESVPGTLEIVSPGLAGTNCKMQVASTADTGDRARVYYDTAGPEPTFRARFFFNIDQSTIDNMTSTTRVKMFNAQCQPASACPNPGIIQFKLRGDDAGGALIRGFTRTIKPGLTGTKERFDLPVVAGEQLLEVQWIMSSGGGATDGSFRAWVNQCAEGSPDIEMTGLENDSWNGVSRFNMGNIKANARDTNDGWNDTPALVGAPLDFDEFEARRSTYIGGCTT